MKLTNNQIKQIIKEELKSVLKEYVTAKLRERAKDVTYNGVTFQALPLTEKELDDVQPKDKKPEQNYAGAYLVKYIDNAQEKHLYNALKVSAFTDQELNSFNIDPKGSVNFVVIINDPDPNKEKTIYDKISSFFKF